MNRITYAGKDTTLTYSKNFEVIISENSGRVTVVPPLVKCEISGGAGIRITLEQAILPFKKITEINDDENCGILFAARQAVYYFNLKSPKSGLVLNALGELLASYLSAFTTVREYSPVVDTVLNEIKNRVSDSAFSLDDYLKKFPLNYDYIRKLFQKEVGATPREYLLNERMKLAQSLLLGGLSNQYSEYTVSQIAEACGFSNPLYFSRVFKNYFGIAPTDYK